MSSSVTFLIRDSRGQLQSVFVFFFAALVIMATLYVGGRLVMGLFSQGCDVQQSDLIRELEQLPVVYNTYGTRQELTLRSACDAQALCLFSQETTVGNLPEANSGADIGVSNVVLEQLRLAISSDVPEGQLRSNVFLVQEDTIVELAALDSLKTPGSDVVCVPSRNGRFRFVVEGKGRYVNVMGVDSTSG